MIQSETVAARLVRREVANPAKTRLTGPPFGLYPAPDGRLFVMPPTS